ncbi:MAG: monovalent cation/H+ antiporter complex subunit F [Burkholderiaceae bacterium]|nr:monovalent cation/H+ antiporter complex subunit F [Burkholderiaceae bacterium]
MIQWATVLLVIASLLALAIAGVRMVRGPTDADRIVALDIFLAAGIALSVAASLLTERTVFLDVGIGLALVGFVGTIGWARLVQRASPAESTEEHS